ncbi:hypothetical protein [Bradyrhizobium sp. AUGA SZCCT0182]|uniref:hypothetical protein n=1 Tax=Bradyrhizobium sp. AUGA SZCCT0182 TaxID=2807667 RepID=UPI001BA57E75|nr:hypothetical protein [Bradyrhizobium sp. AUGA SZCCT0182]MBR1237706.1 hypothetical protein [Bradyrhizobium sp. AUGA SZCCT0182]
MAKKSKRKDSNVPMTGRQITNAMAKKKKKTAAKMRSAKTAKKSAKKASKKSKKTGKKSKRIML